MIMMKRAKEAVGLQEIVDRIGCDLAELRDEGRRLCLATEERDPQYRYGSPSSIPFDEDTLEQVTEYLVRRLEGRRQELLRQIADLGVHPEPVRSGE